MEKCLLIRLQQGRCKMSLEYIIVSESKEVLKLFKRERKEEKWRPNKRTKESP